MDLVFDVSGNKGNTGLDGLFGDSAWSVLQLPCTGKCGHRGGDGKPSGHLIQQLASEADQLFVNVNGVTTAHPLDAELPSITLRAQGGAGGRGGDGGQGGSGYRVDRYSVISDSKGADGGQGGRGGAGGRGGQIRIELSEADLDLLMLNRIVSVSGGVGGYGGVGGRGGIGYSRNLSSPWALCGRPGKTGARGTEGESGSVMIHVVDGDLEGDYPARYDLRLLSHKVQDTFNKTFIEPGEHFKLQVELGNQGGMPLPLKQAVRVQGVSSEWLQCEEGSQDLPLGLKAGEERVLDAPFVFQASEWPLANGNVESKELPVPIRARVSRVERDFEAFTDGHTVTVRHPLQMEWSSADVRPVAAGVDGHLELRLHNVAKKALGSLSESGRQVKVSVSVAEDSGVPASALKIQVGPGQAQEMDIDQLAGEESRGIPVTLRLLDPSYGKNQQLRLVAQLALSAATEEAALRPIQRQSISMQTAEAFQTNAQTDLALVISGEKIGRGLLAEWQRLCADLGLRATVLNQSLYQTNHLFQPLSPGEQSPAEQLQGKGVVFLGDLQRTLSQQNLLQMRDRLNIRSYLVGPKHPDQKTEFRTALDDNAHEITIFGIPSRDSAKQQERLQAGIRDAIAARRSFGDRTRYGVEVVERTDAHRAKCFKREVLGRIRLHPSGRLQDAQRMAQSCTEEQLRQASFVRSESNVHGILNTQSFGRKLQLWEGISAEFRHMLRDSLEGDLLSEYAVLRVQCERESLADLSRERVLRAAPLLSEALEQPITELLIALYVHCERDLNQRGSRQRKALAQRVMAELEPLLHTVNELKLREMLETARYKPCVRLRNVFTGRLTDGEVSGSAEK